MSTVQFVVYDSRGQAVRFGTCPEDHVAAQAKQGERAEVGQPPAYQPPALPEMTYADYRAANYPKLEDLADAIYWQSQGDDSKMKTYLAKVKAVKEKYPKQ